MKLEVSMLCLLCTFAVVSSERNYAFDSVKNSLRKVKVSMDDGMEVERELRRELFDEWKEGFEVMKTRKIPMKNICTYLDHLQSAYEGIDEDLRKKMNSIVYSEESWEYKIVEWKFDKGDNSGARYGMIAFERSPDLKYVDCMYVMYKMDFKIAPSVVITQENHSILFGLLTWTSKHVHSVERSLSTRSIKLLQNFFRMKALQKFYSEGLIEYINYVPSLEEIPEEKHNTIY